MNVTTHQEKEKSEKTKTGKRKAGEERGQAICAALVRSFRRQHGEKMVCARGCPDNWDPLEGHQPFQPTPKYS